MIRQHKQSHVVVPVTNGTLLRLKSPPFSSQYNMPIYEYSCSECTEHHEQLLKVSQMEEPLGQPCPFCESVGTITQEATTFSLADPIALGHKRPDAGFNEVLSKIKQAHPRHTMNHSKFASTRVV